VTLFRPVKLHGNTRLTPVQRRLLCERFDEDGWAVVDAADAAGSANGAPPYGWLGGGPVIVCWLIGGPRAWIPKRTPARRVATIER